MESEAIEASAYPIAAIEGRYGGWFVIHEFNRVDVTGYRSRLDLVADLSHGDDCKYFEFMDDLAAGKYTWLTHCASIAFTDKK